MTLARLVVAPAENTLLPQLVGAARLPAANSLNALNDNLGRIAGPAIGGALLAIGGFTVVVVFDAFTFLIAAGLIWLIRIDTSPRAAHTSGSTNWRQEWLDGLAAVRASTLVTVIFTAAGIALLGDAALSSLLAPFVAQTLTSGTGTLGLFLTARGIGGVIGSLISVRVARRISAQRMTGGNLLALSGVVAAMVAVPIVPAAMIAAGLLGVFIVGWTTSQQTLIQTNVANQFLGRAYGVFGTITAVTLILGSLLAGALADRIGVPALLAGAALCYAVAGLWALVGVRLLHRHRQHRLDNPVSPPILDHGNR